LNSVTVAVVQLNKNNNDDDDDWTTTTTANMGQLLFAPWAWVYSTLHPFGVGK